MEFDFSYFPCDVVHLSGFGKKKAGVMDLDSVAQIDTVFSHGWFTWMIQTDVLVMLLDPGLSGTVSLPSAELTTQGTLYITEILSPTSFIG
jgi:hypothetical protein